MESDVLFASANEGLTLDWSDFRFAATHHVLRSADNLVHQIRRKSGRLKDER